MPKNKTKKKDDGTAALASVQKEMAKPRIVKSALKKYAKLESLVALREAGQPSSREAAGRQLEGEP